VRRGGPIADEQPQRDEILHERLTGSLDAAVEPVEHRLARAADEHRRGHLDEGTGGEREQAAGLRVDGADQPPDGRGAVARDGVPGGHGAEEHPRAAGIVGEVDDERRDARAHRLLGRADRGEGGEGGGDRLVGQAGGERRDEQRHDVRRVAHRSGPRRDRCSSSRRELPARSAPEHTR